MDAEQGYDERVCVVITSHDVSEEETRRLLGDSLPLKFTDWAEREYMVAIRSLQPRVIVSAASDGLADENAALLRALLDSTRPTIASLVMTDNRLTVHQLGTRAHCRIHSLEDLTLDV